MSQSSNHLKLVSWQVN